MLAKKIIVSQIIILFAIVANANLLALPQEIIHSFETGNLKSLSPYLNNTIELTIDGNEDVYSKAQAEIILRDFFKKNPPNRFIILHEGGKENSKYAIGRLITANQNFRITLLLKQDNDNYYIHQLRIEKDDME